MTLRAGLVDGRNLLAVAQEPVILSAPDENARTISTTA
jgi:hypothetical protein